MFLFASSLEAGQEIDVTYERAFKTVALLKTKAEYSNFILHSFKPGLIDFDSALKQVQIAEGKVWTKEVKEVTYVIAIIPIDIKVSVVSLFTFGKNKLWNVCEIGNHTGGYELHKEYLESTEERCYGEF